MIFVLIINSFQEDILWFGLFGIESIGLDWIGLDWIGLDWIGLDWIGWESIYVILFGEII